jgi:hypothetical protein
MIAPIAGPCDSPKVLTLNMLPKVFPAIEYLFIPQPPFGYGFYFP